MTTDKKNRYEAVERAKNTHSIDDVLYDAMTSIEEGKAITANCSGCGHDGGQHGVLIESDIEMEVTHCRLCDCQRFTRLSG